MKIDFAEIEWIDSAIGLRVKTFETDGKQLRLAEFSRNFQETDWCEKSHIGYVIAGEIEIDFAGRAEIFKQGDGIFICPGKKHKARAMSEITRLFLVEDV
jgi:mannose-6-phosphate isomerase-like protein (cupin superfamily)